MDGHESRRTNSINSSYSKNGFRIITESITFSYMSRFNRLLKNKIMNHCVRLSSSQHLNIISKL
jgi:hypothetical protein